MSEKSIYNEKTVIEANLDGVDLNVDSLEKNTLPMIVLNGAVFFPHRNYQLDLTGERDKLAIDHAQNAGTDLFLSTQVPNKKEEQCYDVGVVAELTDKVEVQGGGYRVVLKIIARAKLTRILTNKPFFKTEVEIVEKIPVPTAVRLPLIHATVRNFEKFISVVSHRSVDVESKLVKIDDGGIVADIIADNMPVSIEAKQGILETLDEEERLNKLLALLQKETEIALIQKEIEQKLQKRLSKNQREYYLREQIKVIQAELGDDKDHEKEIKEMKRKLRSLKLPKPIHKKISVEIDRYSRITANTSEAGVIRTYVMTILSLPWKTFTLDDDDILKAEKILDEDHYGLEKVKERILEYLAVRSLNPNMKGQIICLFGPPGVGKTSIGRSIAKALGRKFSRMSLGGIRDEAEIRGHRRTYVGAIPGRIINCIKDAGTKNPLILLDEIDKLAGDFRGDPAGALLEVLDPEQNKEFTDNYLEVPFDLSQVIFLATANRLSSIPRPLLDRMEVIEISGYTEDEKFHIASKYLVPKKMEEHGLAEDRCTFSEAAIREIINSYTRESGVRELERKIAEICRKVAVRVVKEKVKTVKITERSAVKLLGNKKHRFDPVSDDDQVGIVTGLAWTPVGGETLSVEVNVLNGGSGKLRITGQIGDVMRESAEAALSYIRTVTKEYRIDEEVFKTKDIHIHIPEGAIPKDGPSAGVTMATALISALSDVKVSRFVAMTGEITLRGRVLAIGGLKEKSLAAMRAGIKTVIFPAENQQEYNELPDVVKETLKFIPVKNMKQVLKNALLHEKQKEKTEKSEKN